MEISRQRLFVLSCIALTATSMTFAIRAGLINELGTQFGISSADMGWVSGTAFWGFTLSMLFGGMLYDKLGSKKLLVVAFVGHVLGVVLTILSSGFWSLFISTLFIGLANGMVEAACNPMISQTYVDRKTKMLNRFHVWFPGGIVIGGLLAYGMTLLELGWQLQVATILIPTLIYGVLVFTSKFPEPQGEEVQDARSMLVACKSPLFWLMVVCMLFTAATELGTNQWMVALLESLEVPSILLLVFINGLMMLGRSFAGSFEKKLSPPGMLVFSALFSALGLFLLGNLSGTMTFVSAGIFAVGICFFWPTMLGFVAEYLPKTGALGLSIMGAAGMLSVAVVLPLMGDLYDQQTVTLLPEGMNFNSASEELLVQARLSAGANTLKLVALLPALLLVVFAGLYLQRKKYMKVAVVSILLLLGSALYALDLKTSFENFKQGHFFLQADWEEEGFNSLWVNGFDQKRCSIDSTHAFEGKYSLKVLYLKGGVGPKETGGQTPLSFKGKKELFASYALRFDKNFSWGTKDQGGKLPGLASGKNCSGGMTCDGTNGFSARLMWRAGGKAVLYLYHMDKPHKWGEDIPLLDEQGNQIVFERGKWYEIKERVKINTGNNHNGEVEVWINNKQVLLHKDIQMVNNGDLIDNFYFSTFHGGNTESWAPTHDSYIWFDDIRVWE